MQAFFASVTHELRTPLTSIRLQAEAIAEGEQRAELARRLLEDSHRLESQIDKTLELARIEGGGPLSEQAMPLHALACARARGHRARRTASGWICARTWMRTLPPVQADAARAADDPAQPGRELGAPCAGAIRCSVRLTASRAGQRVVLEYQDNGRGVAARHRAARPPVRARRRIRAAPAWACIWCAG